MMAQRALENPTLEGLLWEEEEALEKRLVVKQLLEKEAEEKQAWEEEEERMRVDLIGQDQEEE